MQDTDYIKMCLIACDDSVSLYGLKRKKTYIVF